MSNYQNHLKKSISHNTGGHNYSYECYSSCFDKLKAGLALTYQEDSQAEIFRRVNKLIFVCVKEGNNFTRKHYSSLIKNSLEGQQ